MIETLEKIEAGKNQNIFVMGIKSLSAVRILMVEILNEVVTRTPMKVAGKTEEILKEENVAWIAVNILIRVRVKMVDVLYVMRILKKFVEIEIPKEVEVVEILKKVENL